MPISSSSFLLLPSTSLNRRNCSSDGRSSAKEEPYQTRHWAMGRCREIKEGIEGTSA